MTAPGDPGAGRLGAAIDALRREGLLAAAVGALPVVTSVIDDSRLVRSGALFLALPGTRTDGVRFIDDAVQRGAALVLTEREIRGATPVLLVRDARRAARTVARAWYGDPSGNLTLVGLTGTNGKTTTTALLRHLLNARGDAGSIGTVGAFDGAGGMVASSAGTLTTPGPVDLQATFAGLAERGLRAVVMEASSHSLDQGRLDGLAFAAAVFTNLSHDHLDYHGSMDRYLAAKLRLAELIAPDGVLVVNRDDPAWETLGGRRAVGFGWRPGSDVSVEGAVLTAEGSRFRLTGVFGSREASIPHVGDFNVTNALAAAAAALALGLPLALVAERLATAPQVPGRLERIATRPCAILRDYAHTPDALERVLAALRPLTRQRLIVVFGCGGDRDRGKRPVMGRIAVSGADLAIATSDNPRSEDPERILDDVAAGMRGTGHLRITDRRAAIAHAIGLANEGDTIVLAGKGHETYQVIGTVKHPFDERDIVRKMVGG